ncbi:Putitive phosphate transport regulator [Caldicellulosiruptor obsidiansis OB47]|uniref:Putitive phosphate transport regulator n=1 Tax=Caldicellulosiruptor obsidiansis (strain ATCC BAA-2073 / JCM 16842 / OB47) TaxID=608506 RepID=D9TK37_CALOO|nr:DUF47 family protein [Caldicellulosiruptor obsidiansis]ADL42369.1 Putitive phosphate transport regulator [Caldicellulosiruptor obsidiansis OB47]
MWSIIPKENQFFVLLEDAVENAYQSAVMLNQLLNNLSNMQELISKLEKAENKGDDITHQVIELLNKTFITPLDREDLFAIIKEIDNIVDSLETVAHRFEIYNVNTVRPEAKILSEMIINCTKELKGVVENLKDLKNTRLIKEKIIEVNRIEDEGDIVYRNAIKKLFAENKDKPIEVIIWKEIFGFLEDTLDACEDVANVIEGVVTKNA